MRKSGRHDVDSRSSQLGTHRSQCAWGVRVTEEKIAAGSTHIYATTVDANELFGSIDADKCASERGSLAISTNNLHLQGRAVPLGLRISRYLNLYPTTMRDLHCVNKGHWLRSHAAKQASDGRKS